MNKQERDKIRESIVDEKDNNGWTITYFHPNKVIELLDHIDAMELALQEIANPIKFWKDNLTEDEELNIHMAMSMSNSPNTYQQIAKKVLSGASEKSNE